MGPVQDSTNRSRCEFSPVDYNVCMQKRWDLLGVGTVAVDDILMVDRFPRPDEKIPARSVRRQGGGQTATALVAAARQGARTAFHGCLGEDELSRFTLSELAREGVDTSLVVHQPGSRPFYTLIIVDTTASSRTILFSNEGVTEPDMDRFDPTWIEQSRVLFFDQNLPVAMQSLVQAARETAIPIVADIEKINHPGILENLPLIDHLIVPRHFAASLTGRRTVPEMLDALDPDSRVATVITCGREGCWYQTAGGTPCHRPAFEVAAVDTTGCGDNFVGGIIASVARQIHSGIKKPDLREASCWGIVSGGIACFYMGGTYFEENTGEKLDKIKPYFKAYKEQTDD